MGYEKRNSSYPQFTDHCFTGEYPIEPIDANNKDFVNDQLSSMSSKYDLKDMQKFINATTLKFLSIEGLYKSMGYEKRNPSYPQFTDHCFTGEYPIKPVDANNKDFLDNQLSFMSSKS